LKKRTEKNSEETATIAKKEAWIAKGDKDESEIRWLQADIKRLGKEIVETQKTVEKYEKQLAGEIERERVMLTEVPESMKALQAELMERWNSYDFERKAKLKAEYKELGYEEFSKGKKKSDFDLMYMSDAEITKNNELDAKDLIIDLFYRIRHITGEVTDWTSIHWSGGALNGLVIVKRTGNR
jgi:hypothetical protein